MKQYQYLLFDLDGTLIDPLDAITRSAQYALDHFGIHVEDNLSLKHFIGPPLKHTFIQEFGFDEETAQKLVEKYRERFSTVGFAENKLYDGVGELLRELKASGKTLLLATSKLESFAEEILNLLGIRQYFDFVAGSMPDTSRAEKEEVIRYVLELAGVEDMGEALMIGDRKYDVEGAHAVGMACVGVIYGYGGREELEACRADYLCQTVEELKSLLLS